MEIWKAIPEFPNYEVSNFGGVRTIATGFIRKTRIGQYGYPIIGFRKPGSRKSYYRLVHRLVYIAFNGPVPEGLDLDHIDRNRGNPNLINLRAVTRPQNNHRKQVKNKFGYRGVYLNYNNYGAKIRIAGKHVGLGTYKTPEEAALAYNRKALEIYGECAELNKV